MDEITVNTVFALSSNDIVLRGIRGMLDAQTSALLLHCEDNISDMIARNIQNNTYSHEYQMILIFKPLDK